MNIYFLLNQLPSSNSLSTVANCKTNLETSETKVTKHQVGSLICLMHKQSWRMNIYQPFRFEIFYRSKKISTTQTRLRKSRNLERLVLLYTTGSTILFFSIKKCLVCLFVCFGILQAWHNYYQRYFQDAKNQGSHPRFFSSSDQNLHHDFSFHRSKAAFNFML